MREALFYKKEDGKTRCLLCPHVCLIAQNERGKCKTRINFGGKLNTLVYGESESERHYFHVDPIEKKPLYHFYPGSYSLSFGTPGCNLFCENCQNYTLSQSMPSDIKDHFLKPEKIVELAKSYDCKSISYTYTEPTVFYEYLVDTSKIAKDERIKNVWVTNGFINPNPLKEVLPFIDAMNIDLKSFSEDFYKNVCGGRLRPVLETIKTAAKATHVEITNLLIPTLNDSEEEINNLVNFVSGLGDDIPLHFSAYRPMYKMNIEPTPISTLYRAKEIAEKKLKYVYLGNVTSNNNTLCPVCKNTVVKRNYKVKISLIDEKCPICNTKIPIKIN
ncbi:MAG: molybdenum cofactor biosynthesis protein A [Candidatus Methanofastidiosum methylothiophilum]|uniref:Molybdenum cofactor biosynthesis protein A n=1 Tax=Candidatus Methanofastidiosum methylothiophilum TaxID=1705564 RepID=A0A150IVZ9_9EURY|nr:MAG: molybdenum cofactor biosynthesis protein A [Candidatus Methanofastidiosum methylthiophilus]KYC46948.1 MAG: molybdenum cofactor biosynthesis protein A [Candidatus Methanofastidiosum methylthiophilus]KYC49179.1 MAG: molybdenum cofactor biosynthesis protein A [Candidatus Methanofastidiosum methylthiophilus]